MKFRIKKISALTLLLISMFAISALAQDKYNALADKSKMTWLGEKVTGEHSGDVSLKSGVFEIKDNKIVSGKFEIDMQSITCTDIKDDGYNKKLVGHLKSEDFFGVEKHPIATFVISKSSSFEKGSAEVSGKLTVKGTTNPLKFKATIQKKDGGLKIYGNIVIDRTKYNVKYGSGSFFDNLGDKTIYDEFKLKLNLFAAKSK